MIFLPKEKALKFFGRFFLVMTGFTVLFGSLILSGLEIMANDKKTNNLRSVPIEYVKEMNDGEKIVRVYKVPESKVGPENVKYPLKKLRDSLWIKLSKTPKDKAEVLLLIADKRMFETTELIKNKKDEKIIFDTLNEAVLNLKESKEILSKIDKKDIETTKVDQQINQAGLAYEDIVKSFNYKNEKKENIINELESWNQKNNQEEGKK